MEQQTAMHIAARHDAVDVLRILVKIRSSDLLMPDCFGRSPIHLAAEYGMTY